jgi:hypothetical protein
MALKHITLLIYIYIVRAKYPAHDQPLVCVYIFMYTFLKYRASPLWEESYDI